MAEISPPNLVAILLSGAVSLSFLLYHTFVFDRFRCLIPRRSDWFRCLLTYMLLVSNVTWIVWAGGWCYVKSQLGWVRIGPFGARPWPSALFPEKYSGYNAPLTILFGICYGLQACLNAEEGLYWYHLIRSTRRPQSATPFLKSWFFKIWLVCCALIFVVQLGVPWVGHDGNLSKQLSKELLTGGLLEFVVLVASTLVVLKFPAFLRDIEVAGAGPEVRARLHFFHEANKVRTFFRFTFTIPLLILGIDGITVGQTINTNPLATDFLAGLTAGSLTVVMMISIVLYLPRSSPSAVQNKVLVGQTAGNPNHAASGFALMTLLREGGQWDGAEEDMVGMDGRAAVDEAPFASAEARRMSWNNRGSGEKWAGRAHAPHAPINFTSPIAVSTEPARGPVEIHIHVEREIHKD